MAGFTRVPSSRNDRKAADVIARSPAVPAPNEAGGSSVVRRIADRYRERSRHPARRAPNGASHAIAGREVRPPRNRWQA